MTFRAHQVTQSSPRLSLLVRHKIKGLQGQQDTHDFFESHNEDNGMGIEEF